MIATPQERISRARAAQFRWAALPFRRRVAHLKRLRHSLLDRSAEIVRTVQDELGKPAMDVLSGDVMVTAEQMRFYEKHAEKSLRSRTRRGDWIFFRGTRTQEHYEPHGVAMVIAPWNYPVQLSLIPTVTALFAGNAVLCKCSEQAPKTAMLLQKIVSSAELPTDLVQISWETGQEAAALLEAGPDFVFFTGSSSNGRKVAARAGQLLIPSAMELGGKDAAVVFASCNFERAVNGLVYGAFVNSGQVCVSAKRIYIEAAIFDRFVNAFETETRKLRLHKDIGPVLVQATRDRFTTQITDAREQGARLSSPSAESIEVLPAILREVPAAASLLSDESFGPVVCVAPFHTEAEAIALANSTEFGLSASVWTSDKQQAERLAKDLRVGSCAVNDVIRTVGHPGAAFGGVGASGYGRYHGEEGLRTFSRIKTVMVAKDNNPTQVNWFPFADKTYNQLHALLRFRHSRESLGKRVSEIFHTMRGSTK